MRACVRASLRAIAVDFQLSFILFNTFTVAQNTQCQTDLSPMDYSIKAENFALTDTLEHTQAVSSAN